MNLRVPRERPVRTRVGVSRQAYRQVRVFAADVEDWWRLTMTMISSSQLSVHTSVRWAVFMPYC